MSIYSKKGIIVRTVYLAWSVIWYVITLRGRLGRGHVVVLCYHGICQAHHKRFQWQMSKISGRAAGIDVLLQKKPFFNLTIPKILVTFDDAFVSLLENAVPVLNRYCIPAIIFAVPGNSGQKPKWLMPAGHPEAGEIVMTAQQVSEVHNTTITIGSHTQNHPDLTRLLPNQIEEELKQSKKNLEQLVQKPVEDLAFPHGSYNPDVLEIARRTGYKRLYSLDADLYCGQSRKDVIGRFSMSPDVWPLEFFLTCAGAYQWLGPWRRMVTSVRKVIRPITQRV